MKKAGCMSCGGSMSKGGTKKPVMRGGKIATKSTASFPSVSTKSGVGAKKKYQVGGSTSKCGPGGKCKEGNYNKGRGTGGAKTGIFQKIRNVVNPGRLKLK